MEKIYKPEIDTPPYRIAKLPVSRGFPVPWFVAWIDGEPEFRTADQKKIVMAITDRICWVCGEKLGAMMTFVIGPMCAINRISSEPPSHLDCAEYSVRNCPFLSKPQMVRRENNMPEECCDPSGIMIRRNPGVTLLWTTKSYSLVRDHSGGLLFNIGPASSTNWYREGRSATRKEVEDSTLSGLPNLENMCRSDRERSELIKMTEEAKSFWPKG